MILEEISTKTDKRYNKLSKELCLSLLRKDRPIYITAWGMSMYPFLKSGDRLKITSVKGGIRLGDLITVDKKDKSGGWFIVHRVVKISKDKKGSSIYFTKGDAQTGSLDSPVNIEGVTGKVLGIQRNRLEINLENHGWKLANVLVAKLSLKYPRLLIFLSRPINIVIERKVFFAKISNRLRKGNPLRYNSEELLLLCARQYLNEGLSNKAAELIKEGIGWEYFIKLAKNGGVTVLVYDSLEQLKVSTRIPQSVFDGLKPGYLYIAAKTAYSYQETIKFLKLFNVENIPVMPLKGTFLAKRIYADIASRGLSVDLDLLVEEKNKGRAKELLEGNGYTLYGEEIERWQWQYDFDNPGQMPIDLHWDITMALRSKKRIEGLWEGARLAEECGATYYEPGEAGLLLYLCAHFVNSSRFVQLRSICDINELLSRYKNYFDWDSLVKKAKEWKLSGSLYSALKAAKVLFNTELPSALMQEIRPSFLKLVFIKIFINRKVILTNCLRKKVFNNFLSYIFLELIEACSTKEYLAVIKRVFLPPQEALDKRSYLVRIFTGTASFVKKTFS